MILLKHLKANKDAVCIFSIIMCGFFFMLFFKMRNSFSFLNLDEFLWMYRSRIFMDRIMEMDLGHLIQSAQPGIMVMWLAGPFMKLVDFDFSKIADLIKTLNDTGGYNVINDPTRNYYSGYELLSFLFNVPMVLSMLGFVVLMNYFLRRVGFEKRSAFLSILLIVTTPYYVFFTTPADKLVGIFSVLSLLSLLVYAKESGRRKYLIFSALAASWAALTKLSALFMAPFTFFVLFAYGMDRKKISDLKALKRRAYNVSRDFLLWLSVFMVSNVIFLPTIIVNPAAVHKLFFGEKSFGGFLQNNEDLSFFETIAKYFNDPFLLSFNLFVMVVFAAFFSLIVRGFGYKIDIRKDILFMCFFMITFFFFTAAFSKAYSFRYLVPALILLQVIAGAGFNEFSKILSRRSRIYSLNETFAWAVVFILLSQALLIHYSDIVPIN